MLPQSYTRLEVYVILFFLSLDCLIYLLLAIYVYIYISSTRIVHVYVFITCRLYTWRNLYDRHTVLPAEYNLQCKCFNWLLILFLSVPVFSRCITVGQHKIIAGFINCSTLTVGLQLNQNLRLQCISVYQSCKSCKS